MNSPKNFICLLVKLRTKFTSLIAKSTRTPLSLHAVIIAKSVFLSCIFVYNVVTLDNNHKFLTAADLPTPKPFKSVVFDNKSQKTWRIVISNLEISKICFKKTGMVNFRFFGSLWLQSPCFSLRFCFMIHVHKTVSSYFEFPFELALSY